MEAEGEAVSANHQVSFEAHLKFWYNFVFLLSYFDKGKCWEKGVPLCKELAHFYETKLYDYNKLSDVLTTEAKFFQNILTQIRPEPEYFRVGFFGKGFPLFVRVSLIDLPLQ